MSKPASHKLLPYAAAAFVLAYFFAFTWRGLFVYFNPDDMMNLYWAYTEPVWRLVATLFVPFTTAYRPTGAVIYRFVYELGGFHPFPFRAVAYLFLCLNIGLLYLLARRLTGSRETALLAALIGCYHHRALDLYDENGTIYDVLCYTFFLGAILAYARLRESPSLARWAVCYLTLTAALNAKEMALTIPAVLLAYEWLYLRKLISAPLLMSIALTALTLAAKLGTGSKLVGNPAYAREISLSRFFENAGFYLSGVLYLQMEAIAWWGVIAVIAAVVGVAAMSGRRDLKLLAVWILVTPLPILFIPRRSFFVMYLPLAGWATYTAILISRAFHWANRVMPEPREPSLAARASLFFATALALAIPHSFDRGANWAEDRELQRFRNSVVSLAPSLRPGSRLLFLRDPFDLDNWLPSQILPLSYNDPHMKVDRVKMMSAQLSPAEIAAYDAVFDWVDGRAIRLK